MQTLANNAAGAFTNFLAEQVLLIEGINVGEFAEPFWSAIDATDTLGFVLIGGRAFVLVDFGVNHVDIATDNAHFGDGTLGLVDGFPPGLFLILH